jgi:hypothetical protein
MMQLIKKDQPPSVQSRVEEGSALLPVFSKLLSIHLCPVSLGTNLYRCKQQALLPSDFPLVSNY